MKSLLFIILLISYCSVCFSQKEESKPELNGIVTVGKGKRKRVLDYDFKIIYSNDSCKSYLNDKILDFSVNYDSLNYTAPVFSDGSKDLLDYLVKEVHFPKYALENNIMGKVYVHFIITADGIIKDIWIKKGVHISIDKEAMRVFRTIKFSSPPLLLGKPFETCIDMPIDFILSE